MQIVIWIVIILLAVLLIWLLKKWIRRIIFILILLALAFLIYGIFSPSGAARLWYNVRTFPSRVISWMSSSKEFLDYDSYKLNLPSIKDVDLNVDLGKDSDIEVENDLDKTDKVEENNKSEDIEIVGTKEEKSDNDGKTIRSFAGNTSLDFVKMKPLDVKGLIQQSGDVLTGYSKSDLLGIINGYLESNLDDDTDILVTVEYEDENNPQKIILQTQSRDENEQSHSAAGVIEIEKKEINQQTKTQVTNAQQNKSSNKLTQQEIKEAEEIFSILF